MLVPGVQVSNTDVIDPPLIEAMHTAKPTGDLVLSAVVDERPLTVVATPRVKPQAARVIKGERTLSVRYFFAGEECRNDLN